MALADSIMVLAELCHQPGGGCVRFEGVREGPSHGPVCIVRNFTLLTEVGSIKGTCRDLDRNLRWK